MILILHVIEWLFLRPVVSLIIPLTAGLFFSTCSTIYGTNNMDPKNNQGNSSLVSVDKKEHSEVPKKKHKRKKKISKKRDVKKKLTDDEDKNFVEAYKKNDIIELERFFNFWKKENVSADSKEGEYLRCAISALLNLEAKNIVHNNYKTLAYIQALINHPVCNINQKNIWGKAPIHGAVFHNNKLLLKMLLEKQDIEVNQLDGDGLAPIHRAIMFGYKEVLVILLKARDIEPNILGKHGYTPIHRVIMKYNSKTNSNNSTSLLALLLQHKDIDPNILDIDGLSPIHKAIVCGDADSLSILLKHKDIRINIPDKNGLSLIHYLVHWYHPPIWSMFMEDLELGIKIDVNAQDRHGCTALHYALYHAGDSKKISIEVVDKLLEHKHIDVNVVSNTFHTPLHTLIFNKRFNKELYLKLLSHEKLNLNHNIPRTIHPYAFAWIVGNKEAIKIFKEDERFITERRPVYIKWYYWTKKLQQTTKSIPDDLKSFSDLFYKLNQKIIDCEQAKIVNEERASSSKR